MVSFDKLRSYVEEHEASFPDQLREELIGLKRDAWTDPNKAVRLNETMRVLRHHPAVYEDLERAGLVDSSMPNHESAAADVRGITAPESGQSGVRVRSTPRRNTRSPRLTAATLESLAMWDRRLAIGKEMVTAAIGLLIVLVTVIVALASVFWVSSDASRAAAKDGLVFLNGLVGVVLGYYFGRLPGETRADKADAVAKDAQRDLDRTVEGVRSIMEAAQPGSNQRGEEGTVLTKDQMERLRDLLNTPT